MTVRLHFEVDPEELIRAHDYCSSVQAPTEIDPGVWSHTFFEMPVYFEVDDVSLLSSPLPLFGMANGLEWTLSIVKHAGAWDLVVGLGALYLQLDGNVLSILNPHLGRPFGLQLVMSTRQARSSPNQSARSCSRSFRL